MIKIIIYYYRIEVIGQIELTKQIKPIKLISHLNHIKCIEVEVNQEKKD